MIVLPSKETYDRIRRARDARVRAEVQEQERVQLGEGRCVGCGGEYRNATAGCAPCWDRERRRKRRQDPVKHAHDLRIWRESSKRKLARRRAAA